MRWRRLTLSLIGAGLCVATQAADWPQWRGAQRDGHADAGTPLPDSLPTDLKPVWRTKIGGGFASPIVVGDKVIYLDENGTDEVAHLVEAATGKEIWSVPITAKIEDEWGMGPRSTPFVDGDRLYVQACNGEFRCLSLADGKKLWGVSFEGEFGIKFLGAKAREGTAARRGNNGCGLVYKDRVILPVGSAQDASLVAFDKLTGKQLWKSGTDEAAYSSLIVATLAGKEQLIAFTADALAGVDPADGKWLWRVPLKTSAKRHAATPVVFGDTVIVNSHTFGMVAIGITRNGDTFEAKPAWENAAMKINLATAVLVDGYLYSHGPNKNFVCVDAKTGEQKWAQPGFGKEYSATLSVGKKLLVVTDDGLLVELKATPEKYEELGQAQICGKNWSHPAYADGKLYLRDSRELLSFDLASPATR
jgi:outer membrane protein assembly factor BamB